MTSLHPSAYLLMRNGFDEDTAKSAVDLYMAEKVEEQRNDDATNLTITVSGRQGAGKTMLMELLVDLLEQQGFDKHGSITESPDGDRVHFSTQKTRLMNSLKEQRVEKARRAQLEAAEQVAKEDERRALRGKIAQTPIAEWTDADIDLMSSDPKGKDGLYAERARARGSLREAMNRIPMIDWTDAEIRAVYTDTRERNAVLAEREEMRRRAMSACNTASPIRQGYGMSHGVSADYLSMEGWKRSIQTAVDYMLGEGKVPAGTEEVTMTVSVLR